MKTAHESFTDALVSANLKNLPGHGPIDSRRVVGRHANCQSVNTDLDDETLAEVSSKGATSANVKGE